MDNKLIAHFYLLSATIIYALTYTIGKEIVPHYMSPDALVGIRLGLATLFFWSISWLHPKHSFTKKEWATLFFGGLLGAGINQLFFIKALELSTPIMTSIIMTLVPVSVMLMSYFFLGKKISMRKAAGIFLGMSGAIGMILLSGSQVQTNAPDPILGNMYQFLNMASISIYIIMMKPVFLKYNPVQLFHWIYLFGFISMSPFTVPQAISVNYGAIPPSIWLAIGFVVFFTSCVALLFNSLALRYLSPTTVSVYIFLQPILAGLFAVYKGIEQIDLLKITAMLFVLVGVYLVSFAPKQKIKMYA